MSRNAYDIIHWKSFRLDAADDRNAVVCEYVFEANNMICL